MNAETAKCLMAIQTELKAPKNQWNDFGKYKYRSCEDILEGVKQLLIKYEVSVSLSDEIVLIGERYYVKATATLYHGDDSISVTAYAREEENKKGMDVSQVTGSSSSYARKYALNGLFCIDDTKDADATNNNNNQPPDAANDVLSDLKAKCEAMIDEFVLMTNKSDTEVIQAVLDNLKIKTPYDKLDIEELKKFGGKLQNWIKQKREALNNGN